jgi:hypothetical protein
MGSGENSSKLWVIVETFEKIVSNTGLHLGKCTILGESYGCGIGIVGGRIGGCGIEGGADRVVRNGSKEGLAESVTFTFMGCTYNV